MGWRNKTALLQGRVICVVLDIRVDIDVIVVDESPFTFLMVMNSLRCVSTMGEYKSLFPEDLPVWEEVPLGEASDLRWGVDSRLCVPKVFPSDPVRDYEPSGSWYQERKDIFVVIVIAYRLKNPHLHHQ